MTLAGAKSFYRTQDAALATAYAAAFGKKYDRTRLSQALLSPKLEEALFRSKPLQAQRKTTKVKPSTSVRRVYGPLTATGPQDVIAAVSVSKGSLGGAAGVASRPSRQRTARRHHGQGPRQAGRHRRRGGHPDAPKDALIRYSPK
ncbi:MAG: hypothetical protein V9G19_19990 [Tetrasphaera sp.]